MEKGDKVYSLWMADTFTGGKFGFWVDEYEVFDPAPQGSSQILLRTPTRDHITSRNPSEIYPSREAAYEAAIGMLTNRMHQIQDHIAQIRQEHLPPVEAHA